ncbi:hypothetical protein HV824_24675 [Myxococcus sp. AM009]|uniref:hypothetical protein n=1 Tax=unclassified Myxococcus TaxID=2648731 RepID=UPI0015954495|nr:MULTISPECIES: hypothetical protein [unclassified Myxococcus]NVJ01288.1 hypothetical protein [Myxococcus sp. AM009]NVJ14967.1 hypothetical protein [Myxococcus sp. AM010]
MKRLLLCALSLAVVVGCSDAPSGQPLEQEGFQVLQHDATTLEATYGSGGAVVRMLAVETQANVVEVTYDFGDPVIGFHIDFNQGVGQFTPSGSPLDASHAHLLASLLEGLAHELPAEGRTRVEEAAERQTSFMQIVPVGEVLTAYEYVSERGWVHLSCTCSRQYIGSGYYRTVGRGCGCTGGSGNGCKGRCGQGCGVTSLPRCVGTTAYTQDCAKHDYGLGSFAAASDDYSFARNNCSCSGVGSCS